MHDSPDNDLFGAGVAVAVAVGAAAGAMKKLLIEENALNIY